MLSPHQLAVALLLFAAGFPATSPAASLSQSVPAFPIYRFAGPPDGATPSGGLVQDSQGRLYGGTQSGGANNKGAIYRLTRQSGQKWTEEILYSFSGPDGSSPEGPLTLDASGNIYGVTSVGGANDLGTAFRLQSTNNVWSLTTLHSFGQGQDGVGLFTGMAFGQDGNLFGVTETGGIGNNGTAFELSPEGDTTYYAIVHYFLGGSDGLAPLSGLISDGRRLVGTTFGGGTSNAGTVFTLSKDAGGAWRERVVYSFNKSGDVGGVATAQGFAGDGHGGFIGSGAGGLFGKGGVFAIAPSESAGSSWNESVLYTFGENPSDPTGSCDLVEGPRGLIYGTASSGGGARMPGGAVFTLSPPTSGNSGWTETNLLNLSPKGFLGNRPLGAVLRHNRVFFGVSSSGGNKLGLDFVFAPL